MLCPTCQAWVENVSVCPHCGAPIEREESLQPPQREEPKPMLPENLGPIEAYLSMLKNTFRFSGRCRRRDFWLAFVTNIVFVLIYFLLVTLPSFIQLGRESGTGIVYAGFGFFVLIGYLLLMCVPILSLMVRRFHDIGRSGFFVLLYIIPIVLEADSRFLSFVSHDNETIRFIVEAVLQIVRYATFIFFFLDSQPGKNKYGDNPKELL